MGMYCNGGHKCGNCGASSPYAPKTDLPLVTIGKDELAYNRGYATGSGSKECVAADDPSNECVEARCQNNANPAGVPGAMD